MAARVGRNVFHVAKTSDGKAVVEHFYQRVLCDLESPSIFDKTKVSSKTNLKEQTKNSNFSDAIYAASKNEPKMMWLNRASKVLGSFSPQKWEVYA